jgi:excisionase family DNA binding protein
MPNFKKAPAAMIAKLDQSVAVSQRIEQPLLRAQDVAELLNVDDKTVHMWAAEGSIPSIRLNKAIRFIREDQ